MACLCFSSFQISTLERVGFNHTASVHLVGWHAGGPTPATRAHLLPALKVACGRPNTGTSRRSVLLPLAPAMTSRYDVTPLGGQFPYDSLR
jgi:hypothetical protein